MDRAFQITVYVKLDGSLFARVENLKNCTANGATLNELFERLQKAIALALSVEED